MMDKTERFPEMKLKVVGQNKGVTTYQVMETYRCYLPMPDEDIDVDYVFQIPAGFTTDLASSPKIFWSIIPPDGLYREAAVVHDFMYANHNVSYPFDSLDRRGADDLFLYSMFRLGVPYTKRMLMYTAVRMFGGRYYNHQLAI